MRERPSIPAKPPTANFGKFPLIRLLTNSRFSLTESAGITASPLESIAGIESDVPVPGPLTIPPEANFFLVAGADAPGLIGIVLNA